MTLIRTYRLALLPKRPMFEYLKGTYIYKTRVLRVPRITT